MLACSSLKPICKERNTFLNPVLHIGPETDFSAQSQ